MIVKIQVNMFFVMNHISVLIGAEAWVRVVSYSVM